MKTFAMMKCLTIAANLGFICAGYSPSSKIPAGQSVKDPTALKDGMPGLQPGKQVPGAPKGLIMPPSAERK